MKNTITKLFSIAFAGIIVLSLAACGKTTEEATTMVSQTENWETIPSMFEMSTEPETTYASCETPFEDQIAAFGASISDEESDTTGKFTAAYVSKTGNSTAILSYIGENNTVEFLVLKFKDGVTYSKIIKTNMKTLSKDKNDLLIDSDSDIIIIRSDIATENSRQIIYNFDGKDYIAVKDNDFDADSVNPMDIILKEYNSNVVNLISFSEKAVKTNIEKYLKDNGIDVSGDGE